MAGIYTAIIVESRPSMKKAQPTMSGITIRRRGTPTCGDRAVSLKMRAWRGSRAVILEDNAAAISYHFAERGMRAAG